MGAELGCIDSSQVERGGGGGHGVLGQDIGAQGSTWVAGAGAGTPSTRSGLAPHGHESLSGAKCLLTVLLLLRGSSPSRRQAASTPAGFRESTNWGISRLNEQPQHPAWTVPGPRPQGSLPGTKGRHQRGVAGLVVWMCWEWEEGQVAETPELSSSMGFPASPPGCAGNRKAVLAQETACAGSRDRRARGCDFPFPSSLHRLPQAQAPPLAATGVHQGAPPGLWTPEVTRPTSPCRGPRGEFSALTPATWP